MPNFEYKKEAATAGRCKSEAMPDKLLWVPPVEWQARGRKQTTELAYLLENTLYGNLRIPFLPNANLTRGRKQVEDL